jgi:hypothetical protein
MLNFYDILFEGTDYQTGKILDSKAGKKLVNSYVLKESRKNLVKGLYVLRFDDPSKERRTADNYITIAHNEQGYHAYNEFSKDGIVVKHTGQISISELKKTKRFNYIAAMKSTLKWIPTRQSVLNAAVKSIHLSEWHDLWRKKHEDL